MIDFGEINGFARGREYSFEELVCQLAHKRPPSSPAVFRRVEGAGGDGGVEGYWLLEDGSKIGYQAKFFLKSHEINWSQIDKSVQQAIVTHPTLVEYVVALPCNLTDRAGLKRKGNTGWQSWESHRAKWEKSARRHLKRVIKFTPWTKSEILGLLSSSDCTGLSTYFFGEVELSPNWFKRQTELAVAALEDRYHADDHVDVAAESIFEFIARHPNAQKKLSEGFQAVKECRFRGSLAQLKTLKAPEQLVNSTTRALDALLSCGPQMNLPPWEPWESTKWMELVTESGTNLVHLSDWAWEARKKSESSQEGERTHGSNPLGPATQDIRQLDTALRQLADLLSSEGLISERARVLLVEGRAGTGKSQLLAHVAEVAVAENRPLILLLGQQLRNEALWPQILRRLDLNPALSVDEFLAVLDAAGESSGTRCLILIDAINEGPGSRLWRDEIASFLEQIRPFQNVGCVLTCRSEYIRYVVTQGVLERLPRVELKGFETPQEQERAARVYLDKRGISRPSTPWLAPEFVNPLFLRSCCEALRKENRREFPRGLVGTKKIFKFFLESVSRHLGTDRDGSDDFVGPTKTSLLKIAEEMAKERKDHLSKDRAEQIAKTCFGTFPDPPEVSWLEVLQRNGLLRFDPDPASDLADPLVEPNEVVRFSFQRFQDHLMAETLLAGLADIKDALEDKGSLAFIHDGKQVHYEWQGLIEALSIQIPERFKIELVDALPADPLEWWRAWAVRDAFWESLRWRDKKAFTDRTLRLFNNLPSAYQRAALLIELSASIDHPWNAHLIHRNLMRMKMPERDQFWCGELASAADNPAHPIYSLIDWCINGQDGHADRQTHLLCGLVLTWCFSLPNRPIRDRATKALTSLLLVRKDIFSDLIAAFEKVDDLYILERLFGAAYGACCIDPAAVRLKTYSKIAASKVFGLSVPYEGLLLRDYALGIIELANHVGFLPADVDIAKCRPPYRSRPPRLNVTEAAIQKIAEQAGDDTILASCTSLISDFGHYEIQPRIGRFIEATLRKPVPASLRDKYERFQREVIKTDKARESAFEQLRDSTLNLVFLEKMRNAKGTFEESNLEKLLTDVNPDKIKRAIEVLEEKLLRMLNPTERRRYRSEARPLLESDRREEQTGPARIDYPAAARWIAKRAYSFGWTKKRFPQDTQRYSDYSRQRPLNERVGKKYQWLALDEFICRLADNYWIERDYGSEAKQYENPLDVGFERDVDPTVIPKLNEYSTAQNKRQKWVLGPEILIPPTQEEDLKAWPPLADPGANLCDLIRREDPQGHSWMTLYDHRSMTSRYEEDMKGVHGLRQQEFRFVYSAIVKREMKRQFLGEMKKIHKVDGHRWETPENVDEAFLFESYWRNTWSDVKWQEDNWAAPKGVPVAFPECYYRWESSLDASLPRGASALVPSPWLISELRLSPTPDDGSVYKDGSGNRRFIGSCLDEDGSSALIDGEFFQDYLDRNALDCVWFFLAERNAWPGGGMNAVWRKSEGLCWLEKGRPRTTTWYEDRRS